MKGKAAMREEEIPTGFLIRRREGFERPPAPAGVWFNDSMQVREVNPTSGFSIGGQVQKQIPLNT